MGQAPVRSGCAGTLGVTLELGWERGRRTSPVAHPLYGCVSRNRDEDLTRQRASAMLDNVLQHCASSIHEEKSRGIESCRVSNQLAFVERCERKRKHPGRAGLFHSVRNVRRRLRVDQHQLASAGLWSSHGIVDTPEARAILESVCVDIQRTTPGRVLSQWAFQVALVYTQSVLGNASSPRDLMRSLGLQMRKSVAPGAGACKSGGRHNSRPTMHVLLQDLQEFADMASRIAGSSGATLIGLAARCEELMHRPSVHAVVSQLCRDVDGSMLVSDILNSDGLVCVSRASQAAKRVWLEDTSPDGECTRTSKFSAISYDYMDKVEGFTGALSSLGLSVGGKPVAPGATLSAEPTGAWAAGPGCAFAHGTPNRRVAREQPMLASGIMLHAAHPAGSCIAAEIEGGFHFAYQKFLPVVHGRDDTPLTPGQGTVLDALDKLLTSCCIECTTDGVCDAQSVRRQSAVLRPLLLFAVLSLPAEFHDNRQSYDDLIRNNVGRIMPDVRTGIDASKLVQTVRAGVDAGMRYVASTRTKTVRKQLRLRREHRVWQGQINGSVCMAASWVRDILRSIHGSFVGGTGKWDQQQVKDELHAVLSLCSRVVTASCDKTNLPRWRGGLFMRDRRCMTRMCCLAVHMGVNPLVLFSKELRPVKSDDVGGSSSSRYAKAAGGAVTTNRMLSDIMGVFKARTSSAAVAAAGGLFAQAQCLIATEGRIRRPNPSLLTSSSDCKRHSGSAAYPVGSWHPLVPLHVDSVVSGVLGDVTSAN